MPRVKDLYFEGVRIIRRARKFVYMKPGSFGLYSNNPSTISLRLIVNGMPKIIEPIPFLYTDGEIYVIFVVREYAVINNSNEQNTFVFSGSLTRAVAIESLKWLKPIVFLNNLPGGEVFSGYLKKHGIDKKRFNLFYLNGYEVPTINLVGDIEKNFEISSGYKKNYMSKPYKFDSIKMKKDFSRKIANIILGTDFMEKIEYE